MSVNGVDYKYKLPQAGVVYSDNQLKQQQQQQQQAQT
jgi:hypothetical protein